MLVPTINLKIGLLGGMSRSIKNLNLSPLTPIGFRQNDSLQSDTCLVPMEIVVNIFVIEIMFRLLYMYRHHVILSGGV
jgi:hypothetical protein